MVADCVLEKLREAVAGGVMVTVRENDIDLVIRGVIVEVAVGRGVKVLEKLMEWLQLFVK